MKGCTSCTRACPRFRAWEPETDEHLFGRDREPDEMYGIYKDIAARRASDDTVHEMGQDGGLGLGHAHLGVEQGIHRRRARVVPRRRRHVVEGRPRQWRATKRRSRVGGQPLHVLGEHAGHTTRRSSRDSRSIALVGMSCQSSVAAGHVAAQGGQGRASRFVFNIGLLCSKTFDDAIFEELFEAKYGLRKQDMVKMNIKGVFQIWMPRRQLPRGADLKECHAWTREGCKLCPDFAAEHADISTGGIGEVQRLDPHDRAHRPRARDHEPHDRLRRHPVSTGRQR